MKTVASLIAFFILCGFSSGNRHIVKSEDSYGFDTGISVVMKYYKKSGKLKDETNIEMWLPSDERKLYFGMVMDVEQGTMAVYDFAKEKMITLMNAGSMKNALIINMNKRLLEPDPEEQESYEDIEFVKTGKTKTIIGYSCEEYTAKTEDGTAFYWVSSSAPNGIIEFFIRAQNQKAKNVYQTKLPEGQVLEMGSIDESGEKYTMEVTEIKSNINKTINLSDYQVIGKL